LTHGRIEPFARRVPATNRFEVKARLSTSACSSPYPQYKGGETLSWPEILEGTDPKLNSIRQDHRLLRWYEYSQREHQPHSAAQDVAETMKYIIFVASRTQELKNPERPSIGPKSDCLLLRAGAEWMWMYENEQPDFDSKVTADK